METESEVNPAHTRKVIAFKVFCGRRFNILKSEPCEYKNFFVAPG